MAKHCAWGTCNSDSRYPERLINSEGKCVQFYHFPSFKKEKIRREAWIRACCRGDNFVCTKHSYMCGLHFIGNNGPTLTVFLLLQAVKRLDNTHISMHSHTMVSHLFQNGLVIYGL